MGHFFSIVYNGMAAARFHGNGFRHTDGGRVFGTDAAIDLLQAQFLESVPQASSGGFRGIAVVPIRIVQDVAKFHRSIPVYHASDNIKHFQRITNLRLENWIKR